MQKADDALRSRLGLWICSPITSHRFRPLLTTKLRLLAVGDGEGVIVPRVCTFFFDKHGGVGSSHYTP